MILPLFNFTPAQWAKIDAMRFRNAYPYKHEARLDLLALCVTEAVCFPAPKQEEPEECFIPLTDYEALELRYLSQIDDLKRQLAAKTNKIRGLQGSLTRTTKKAEAGAGATAVSPEAETIIDDLAAAIAASYSMQPRQWLAKFGDLRTETTGTLATPEQRSKAKQLAKDYRITRKEFESTLPPRRPAPPSAGSSDLMTYAL